MFPRESSAAALSFSFKCTESRCVSAQETKASQRLVKVHLKHYANFEETPSSLRTPIIAPFLSS